MFLVMSLLPLLISGGTRSSIFSWPNHLVLIFPVVSLAIVGVVVYEVWKFRWFGSAELQLETVPAVPGETLRGTVLLDDHLKPENGFRVSLSSKLVPQDEDSGSDDETILW